MNNRSSFLHRFLTGTATLVSLLLLSACSGNASLGQVSSKPTIDLRASATTVTSHSAAQLTWTTVQATGCSASDGWSGTKPIAGSETLANRVATATYTLTCTGPGGSTSQSATITVSDTVSAPTVSLTANPSTVNYNDATSLHWSSTNATSCMASGGWSGAKSLSGDEPRTGLRIDTTYTLTCTGPGGSASQSTAVTVNAPPPSPPPSTGTTMTTVTLTNNGTSGDVVSTFGQYFKAGDVPAGSSVGAAQSDSANTPVILQVDKKATHADGSLKHAVLTARLTLTTGQSQTINLFAYTPGAAGVPVSLAALLATDFDAAVTLNIGNTTHSTSMRALYNSGAAVQTWLNGPEVSEWILSGPIVTNASDIAANPAIGHLMAYFHVRAYAGLNRVRVDTVVENNWTSRSNAGRIDYTATITVGNQTKLTIYSGTLAHYHHSRWHQTGWWGNASTVYTKPDTRYLRDSLAVPNYATLTLKDSVLGRYAQSVTPMGRANMRVNWGDVGYDPQIGLLPEWDASYIVSGADPRTFNAVLANASAGGSYSYHYRDETTGLPPSIDTRPDLSEQGPTGGLVMGTGGNAYSHEPGTDPSAHQPMLGYLAYLLTGDRYYLDELQFLANYNFIWRSVQGRTYLNGGQDGIVGYQNRGQAWGIRTLAHAAAITPDSDPLKSYFVSKLNNNIDQKTAAWASPTANSLGAIQDFDWISGYGSPTYSPWQNDFFVAVFGRVVDLGFTNATTMRNWLAQWPVGRMGGIDNNNGYCWTYATQYRFSAGIVQADNVTYDNSFQQLYQRNFPTESAQACPSNGLMTANSYPTIPWASDSTAGYYGNMQPALAVSVDAGLANQAVWDRFVAAGTPDYSYSPVWAIVPRSVTPAWYSNLKPGQWHRFANSSLSAVDPCPARTCSYTGAEGQAAVMNDWAGGAYDTKNNRLMVWGGGHAGYGGNEVYAFDLYAGSWSLITQPSDPVTLCSAFYPDGRPASSHSYNQLQYLPTVDAFTTFGLGHFCQAGGGGAPNTVALSLSTKGWSNRTSRPTQNGESQYGTFTALDGNGNVWVHTSEAGRRLHRYNIATDTWTTFGSAAIYYASQGATAAVDTKRNRLVSIGESSYSLFAQAWDLNNPSTVPVALSGVPVSLASPGAPGMVYDPVGDRFLLWNGGITVHTLDAATLSTWGTVSINTSNSVIPTAPNERGSYGRFRYVPSLHGLVVVNHTDEDVYFFKLP